MILIITEPNDGHADAVSRRLTEEGADHYCIRYADFPDQQTVSIAFTGGKMDGVLDFGCRTIDLANVTTVWNRRTSRPILPEHLEKDGRRFAEEEWRRTIYGLSFLLRDRFWVNPFEAAIRGESKYYQLKIAQEVGFAVPRTLITSDPAQARAFFEENPGGTIYKALHCYFGGPEKTATIYTNRVLSCDSLTDGIRLAPCIFQEMVPKKVELRITVIGRSLFAAEIDSQANEKTKLDWRHYDLPNTPHRKVELPIEVESKLLKLMERMDLVFGCVDMIITPDGEYVFLEINQMGQWHWIQMMTGFPLMGHFVSLLTQGTPSYEFKPRARRRVA